MRFRTSVAGHPAGDPLRHRQLFRLSGPGTRIALPEFPPPLSARCLLLQRTSMLTKTTIGLDIRRSAVKVVANANGLFYRLTFPSIVSPSFAIADDATPRRP